MWATIPNATLESTITSQMYHAVYSPTVEGMDWLSKHHVEVICFEKCIQIPLPSGDTLRIFGEKPCTHVVEKKDKGKSIQDIPIIQDFPEVFPEDLSGLRPVRQVEFRIDLVPGTNPVAKAPYQLAHFEMQELASQL
ncbi:hypothetical protein L1987_18956 [Smallanthus sonchifolius]|uniref:Uncharacterized protein n=1 Tax=Smallanthus sonchifolius TaxID=185202 RepID=A0ACB9J167_9ASTR|nr:hypothetical protein L1987_18956 [Smallanthus sonchifolius]